MIRVTRSEAMQQLNRLIAVFPRHGMSDEGIAGYAETMAGFFAGEWHMRKVIDAAKSHFRYFPSLAELREFSDEVSAKRVSFTGCPNCIRSTPGLAYVQAMWTPGNDGKPGTFEPMSHDGLEATYPAIEAAHRAARVKEIEYDGQDLFDVPLAQIAEDGETLTVRNPRAHAACVVGYCACQAGTILRDAHVARAAEAHEKRKGSGGIRRAS